MLQHLSGKRARNSESIVTLSFQMRKIDLCSAETDLLNKGLVLIVRAMSDLQLIDLCSAETDLLNKGLVLSVRAMSDLQFTSNHAYRPGLFHPTAIGCLHRKTNPENAELDYPMHRLWRWLIAPRDMRAQRPTLRGSIGQ